MENRLEQILIYGVTFLFLAVVIFIYVRRMIKETEKVNEKIRIAKDEGLHEPVSLHPVVDVNSCIKSGACILACPEKDILGIRNGKATVINASRCVGHGACFHACPTEAISLFIGTEKRGVDLPHVNPYFETNVKGIYIAGEIGGMGLIKNAVEQGKQAVNNLAKQLKQNAGNVLDLVIVGAGPAGISASLEAKRLKLDSVTLEQDSLGGTVFTFPRGKIVMTSPMNLPLHGKVKLVETTKPELLDLWRFVLDKHQITVHENIKVDKIIRKNGFFEVFAGEKNVYSTQKVLLAIGRRGSPKKLNIPGEDLPKVYYRLMEPEYISNKKILVVGGGDSAIESALLLARDNQVTLSYRKDAFARLKVRNNSEIQKAIDENRVKVIWNSNVVSIGFSEVILNVDNDREISIQNDLVYIFAGGELPAEFLKNAGIQITTKYGEALLSHSKR